MDEPKVFSELSLQDLIYYTNDRGCYSSRILKIERDPDDRCRTLIHFFEDNPISVPDNEFIYEEEEMKYTTDKNTHKKWHIPFVERDIKNKELKIESIKVEIQELRDSIK